MGNESPREFIDPIDAAAESDVQNYLKEIDASKLRIYSGMQTERYRQAITGAMQAIGASVTHIPNADEMLASILTSPPDLVIVPVGYNGMENLGFVDQLGADPRTRMQPVLVVTRPHAWVEFAPEDQDRYLGWANQCMWALYFQRSVLSDLSYFARKRRIAHRESTSAKP